MFTRSNFVFLHSVPVGLDQDIVLAGSPYLKEAKFSSWSASDGKLCGFSFFDFDDVENSDHELQERLLCTFSSEVKKSHNVNADLVWFSSDLDADPPKDDLIATRFIFVHNIPKSCVKEKHGLRWLSSLVKSHNAIIFQDLDVDSACLFCELPAITELNYRDLMETLGSIEIKGFLIHACAVWVLPHSPFPTEETDEDELLKINNMTDCTCHTVTAEPPVIEADALIKLVVSHCANAKDSASDFLGKIFEHLRDSGVEIDHSVFQKKISESSDGHAKKPSVCSTEIQCNSVDIDYEVEVPLEDGALSQWDSSKESGEINSSIDISHLLSPNRPHASSIVSEGESGELLSDVEETEKEQQAVVRMCKTCSTLEETDLLHLSSIPHDITPISLISSVPTIEDFFKFESDYRYPSNNKGIVVIRNQSSTNKAKSIDLLHSKFPDCRVHEVCLRGISTGPHPHSASHVPNVDRRVKNRNEKRTSEDSDDSILDRSLESPSRSKRSDCSRKRIMKSVKRLGCFSSSSRRRTSSYRDSKSRSPDRHYSRNRREEKSKLVSKIKSRLKSIRASTYSKASVPSGDNDFSLPNDLLHQMLASSVSATGTETNDCGSITSFTSEYVNDILNRASTPQKDESPTVTSVVDHRPVAFSVRSKITPLPRTSLEAFDEEDEHSINDSF